MAKHKTLESVARNIADSFASRRNYRREEYVMGHLLAAALKSHSDSLEVNLLTGVATPKSLLVPAVAEAISEYVAKLPDLVIKSSSDMAFIAGATLRVHYDLAAAKLIPFGDRTINEAPYACEVIISDDRGRVYHAKKAGLWCSDPITFWQKLRWKLIRVRRLIMPRPSDFKPTWAIENDSRSYSRITGSKESKRAEDAKPRKAE